MKKIPKRLNQAVSKKISKLISEGYPQKQAIAIALNMARSQKLGPRGGKLRNPDEVKSNKLKAALAFISQYPHNFDLISEEIRELAGAQGFLKDNRITKLGLRYLEDDKLFDVKDKGWGHMKKRQSQTLSGSKYNFDQICAALAETNYEYALIEKGKETEKLSLEVFHEMKDSEPTINRIYQLTEEEPITYKTLLAILHNDGFNSWYTSFGSEYAAKSHNDRQKYNSILRKKLTALAKNPRARLDKITRLDKIIHQIEKELKRK